MLGQNVLACAVVGRRGNSIPKSDLELVLDLKRRNSKRREISAWCFRCTGDRVSLAALRAELLGRRLAGGENPRVLERPAGNVYDNVPLSEGGESVVARHRSMSAS
jgi:hypothetical protein